MPSSEERFQSKVKRRGGHDLWTGSTDHRGVGMVRIDGKLKTVQRAAWEFANGAVEAGVRVNTCARERACVNVTHLSLSPTTPVPATRRRRRGTGSLREVRPEVWEITVTDGTAGGRRRRRVVTMHGTRRDAEGELDRVRTLLSRADLGDLRIRELVGRYLEDLDGSTRGSVDDRRLLAEILDPALGADVAALATTGWIQRSLDDVINGGAAVPDVRDALRLLRRAYQWATLRRLHHEDPTAEINTRWLGR